MNHVEAPKPGLAGQSAGPSIIDLMEHPQLFGPHFAGSSWIAWRAFISAVFGLSMPSEQREVFAACTGLAEPPTSPVREIWIVGRAP